MEGAAVLEGRAGAAEARSHGAATLVAMEQWLQGKNNGMQRPRPPRLRPPPHPPPEPGKAAPCPASCRALKGPITPPHRIMLVRVE